MTEPTLFWTSLLYCHLSGVDCWSSNTKRKSSIDSPLDWTLFNFIVTKCYTSTSSGFTDTLKSHIFRMSSSSALHTALLFAAITSQATAFAPSLTTPTLSRYNGVCARSLSSTSAFNLPHIRQVKKNEKLSMGLNFGRNKDTKSKQESTSLQSSAAALDGITKSESKNPITRWIQSVSWPSKKELKKLLPLGTMLFFILFNYTILRDTKVRDTPRKSYHLSRL